MAVLRAVEVPGSSEVSWEDARNRAMQRASESVKNIRSANVMNQSVVIRKGKNKEYHVSLKVSFEVL